MRFALMRQAKNLLREKLNGAPKEKRIAMAKREYEMELRAAGISRSNAKLAVAIRFKGRDA